MGSIPRWLAVRMVLMIRLCAAAPFQVRLPPHTLRFTTAGRMALFATPVGGVDVGVGKEGEQGISFVGQVLDQAPVGLMGL